MTKCPKHCITMKADNEGFLYPIVNKDDCIECGLCEKVCHELHPYESRKPLNVYAAFNKDEEIRMRSSSGGLFYLLAEKTISENGVVFGAIFDEDWQVKLDHAETLDGVKKFMGSKYVQANTATAFKDAEVFLKQGRKVLFSGSPCQIAGLHHYLSKDYDNLITVDFVCHGVPSPKVWGRYLDEVVVLGKKAICDIKFRNKRNGWKKFNFVLSYSQEDKYYSLYSWHKKNDFMQAFLSDMILRPSCYICRAKHGSSHSDITIADFWGINIEMPEMDDDKGTGLMLVNTEKGRKSIDWNKVNRKESSIEVASKYNGGLSSLTTPHPKRSEFFAAIDNSPSVIELITRSLRPNFKVRVYIALGRYKHFIHVVLKKLFCLLFLGGGNKFYKTSKKTHTGLIPPILDPMITDISFRYKQNSWKSYGMVIKMKSLVSRKNRDTNDKIYIKM